MSTNMDGTTDIPQRDVDDMFGAVKHIGAKTLPDGKAYGHIAKCIAAFRPHVHAGNDAIEAVQRDHMPTEDVEADAEITLRDPVGMQRKISEIKRQMCSVRLPGKISDDMLPKKLKGGKADSTNDEGLANCLGVLSPWLYDLTEEEA